MAKPAKIVILGRRAYREVLDMQRRTHALVANQEQIDTWIFVEHDPVVTLGRNTKLEELKLSPAELNAKGLDCVQIERGGNATYHGPGQLVVYPILRLERFREVVPLVRQLEGIVIALCAHFGVTAERWSQHAGVWVGERQICAIGIAIQKMTSLHGIALNVSTEMTYDQWITPCGLSDRGITSLSLECGRIISLQEVQQCLETEISKSFGVGFM